MVLNRCLFLVFPPSFCRQIDGLKAANAKDKEDQALALNEIDKARSVALAQLEASRKALDSVKIESRASSSTSRAFSP